MRQHIAEKLMRRFAQAGSRKDLLVCARLLEQEKVAAVPGIAFGADDYLRISYATSLANIEKGLDRLERFAKSLAK